MALLVLAAGVTTGQFIEVHLGHGRKLATRILIVKGLLHRCHTNDTVTLMLQVTLFSTLSLLGTTVELVIEPVKQLQRELAVVHELDLHELFHAL